MRLFLYIKTQTLSQILRLPPVVNLILTVYLFFFLTHWSAIAETIQIPDPNLRSAIEFALGKSPGDDITQLEMTSLQLLKASKMSLFEATGNRRMGNTESMGVSTC